MGITVIIILLTIVILMIISRLKISRTERIIWSVAAVAALLCLMAYLFIQGFERGRDPQMSQEELRDTLSVE